MIIYVDMDDVLVNFVHSVHDILNTPKKLRTPNIDASDWKTKIPLIELWWENLRPKDDAHILFNFIKQHDFRILTAYADWDKRSIQAKYHWMQKNFGVPKELVHVVQRIEKQNYATLNGQPNVLIDDYDKNCNEWRRAGGIAIHHKGARSSIVKLKKIGFS